MLHDEYFFPRPTEFNPERFLKDNVLLEDLPDPEKVATFGFGRRHVEIYVPQPLQTLIIFQSGYVRERTLHYRRCTSWLPQSFTSSTSLLLWTLKGTRSRSSLNFQKPVSSREY
jgi:hypothetical protein